MNRMRTVRIDKAVINIGVGEAGEKLLKALRVLEMLTAQKPVQTLSRTRSKDWGLRRNMPIGCKVTLRGKRAEEFLKKAFWVKNNQIAYYSFDAEGNFSFGIPDYTEFEDMKYDPEVGLFGMDVSASLRRPGARVGHRRIGRKRIPRRHRITREEGIAFVKEKFNIEVVE